MINCASLPYVEFPRARGVVTRGGRGRTMQPRADVPRPNAFRSKIRSVTRKGWRERIVFLWCYLCLHILQHCPAWHMGSGLKWKLKRLRFLSILARLYLRLTLPHHRKMKITCTSKEVKWWLYFRFEIDRTNFEFFNVLLRLSRFRIYRSASLLKQQKFRRSFLILLKEHHNMTILMCTEYEIKTHCLHLTYKARKKMVFLFLKL